VLKAGVNVLLAQAQGSTASTVNTTTLTRAGHGWSSTRACMWASKSAGWCCSLHSCTWSPNPPPPLSPVRFAERYPLPEQLASLTASLPSWFWTVDWSHRYRAGSRNKKVPWPAWMQASPLDMCFSSWWKGGRASAYTAAVLMPHAPSLTVFLLSQQR